RRTITRTIFPSHGRPFPNFSTDNPPQRRSIHTGAPTARPPPPPTMNQERSCPDCGTYTRRDFLKTTASLAAASTFAGVPLIGRAAGDKPKSETLVATLFKSFTDEQRKALCFAWDNPLRTEVDNNWHVTDQHIGSFLTPDQNQMVKEIFLGLHSP